MAGRVRAAGVIIGLLLPAVPAPAAAARPVLDATGATDVTDALNALLATAEPGGSVTLEAGGRYRVEGTVVIDGLRDVTLDGQGARLFAETDGASTPPPTGGARHGWPRLRTHLAIRDATNVRVEDLTITGPNASGAYQEELEGQAGVTIARSRDVELDGVTVARTYGDGVYVTGDSTRVRVHGGQIEDAGRQGVAIVAGVDVTVEQTVFARVARSVIDIEPVPRDTVAGVRIVDNEIGDYENFLLAVGGGGANVRDVELAGNVVTGGNGIAVYAVVERHVRSGLRILDNTSRVPGRVVSGTGLPGVMQLAQLRDVEIRGNRQDVEDGAAISLANVCDVSVEGNEFPGATREVLERAPCDGAPTDTAEGGGTTAPLPRSDVAGTSPTTGSAPAGGADGASATASTDRTDGDGGRSPWWWLLVPAAGVIAYAVTGRRRRATD